MYAIGIGGVPGLEVKQTIEASGGDNAPPITDAVHDSPFRHADDAEAQAADTQTADAEQEEGGGARTGAAAAEKGARDSSTRARQGVVDDDGAGYGGRGSTTMSASARMIDAGKEDARAEQRRGGDAEYEQQQKTVTLLSPALVSSLADPTMRD
eukprot:COSAG05_NODE_857_length_6940_cov_4.243385_4_plen_154_part_00